MGAAGGEGTSSDTPADITAVGSRFVGPINSAVVMTADGSAGSPLAERLVITVGFGPIGSVVVIATGMSGVLPFS